MKTLKYVCFLSCALGLLKAQTTFTPNSGVNIASVVAASPEGTHFVFGPGIYRNLQIVPKNNDVFTGNPGATLNGSVQLTSFSLVGGLWRAVNQTQVGAVNGFCDSAHPMCNHSEDLYYDDRPLLAVASIANVVSGTWFFDHSSQSIYLADNPNGHKVETSVTRNAFSGPAQNVTIQGFTIEKYAIPGQFGAVGDQYPGTGWIVKNNEIRLNHGAGISLASNGQAVQNFVHNNGQLGIATADTTNSTANNILIEDNEISFNNWAGFDTGWAAGGAKLCSAVNLSVRDNYVHDNFGPGLWTDVFSNGVLYSGNAVRNNMGSGIVHEIGYTATIRNNTVSGNYQAGNAWYWGAQIMIQNSRNVEVYGNLAEVAGNRGQGIVIVQQDRGSGPLGPNLALNNYVHNNTVIHDGAQGSSGLAGDYQVQALLTTNNNRFDSNSYQTPDPSGYYWVWDQPKNHSGMQSAGQELHGTVAAQLNPVLQSW